MTVTRLEATAHMVTASCGLKHACVHAGQPLQLVAVPTHFFKVMLGEKPSSFGAFVTPNQPVRVA